MTQPHPDPDFPNRRASDPPEGSVVARVNEAVKPWYGLLLAISVVWGIAATFLLALGFRVSTPSEEVAALRAEIARERRDRLAADSSSLKDRQELRAMSVLTATQNNEILLVVCTGLADTEARRIPACRRVLYPGTFMPSAERVAQRVSYAPRPCREPVVPTVEVTPPFLHERRGKQVEAVWVDDLMGET